MIMIKAPEFFPTVYLRGWNIFLAGSIEMGKAVQWQERLGEKLADKRVNLFNPRRDDWDSSWVQSIQNRQFNEQVNWELSHIENSDLVVFFFDPETKSPITLAELGYCLGLKKKMIVYCPDEFWRKGNVDIMCARNGLKVYTNQDQWTAAIREAVTDCKMF